MPGGLVFGVQVAMVAKIRRPAGSIASLIPLWLHDNLGTSFLDMGDLCMNHQLQIDPASVRAVLESLSCFWMDL